MKIFHQMTVVLAGALACAALACGESQPSLVSPAPLSSASGEPVLPSASDEGGEPMHFGPDAAEKPAQVVPEDGIEAENRPYVSEATEENGRDEDGDEDDIDVTGLTEEDDLVLSALDTGDAIDGTEEADGTKSSPVIPYRPGSITGEYTHVFPEGEELTVTAWRVARRTGISTETVTDRFGAFKVDNYSASKLYKTRIAEVGVPRVHKTVVFMTAGQKGPFTHASGLTGQDPYWDKSCDREKCPGLTLSGQSMAMKLRATGWFPEDETYMALGVDNNFDYTFSLKNRNAIANGFAAWLKTKITSDTERVILAGFSRGGCLVMKMAQALRSDPAYDGVKIYVSSYDGVCNKGEELGTSWRNKIVNPRRRSGTFYGGWPVDMKAQYPNRHGLNIYHLSGGQEVVPLTAVRAFSGYDGDQPPDVGEDIDWGWYKQTWLPWKHSEIGSAHYAPNDENKPMAIADTIDAQLSWLRSRLDLEE